MPASLDGELHFGVILGGRAMQDVWIVPTHESFVWLVEYSSDAGRSWKLEERMLDKLVREAEPPNRAVPYS